jgi:hypothetical protein
MRARTFCPTTAAGMPKAAARSRSISTSSCGLPLRQVVSMSTRPGFFAMAARVFSTAATSASGSVLRRLNWTICARLPPPATAWKSCTAITAWGLARRILRRCSFSSACP